MLKKRDVLIIDEPFQFKYSLLIGLAGFFASLLISVIIYNYVHAHDKVLLLTGLNQSPEVISYFDAQHKVLIVKLVSLCVVITLFMFLLGLVISNRIAGPVFAIRRRLSEIMATGNYSQRFTVRRRDEFKELASDLNNFLEKLETRDAQDTEKI